MTEDLEEPVETRPVGPRRRGREFALGFLFACGLRKRWASDDLPAQAERLRARGPALAFATRLVEGVIAQRVGLDAEIHRVATNWRIARMAAVDRNILRLAAFELLFDPSTPRSVVINEAVELAKKYGSGQSGSFVNGILDKIRGPGPVA